MATACEGLRRHALAARAGRIVVRACVLESMAPTGDFRGMAILFFKIHVCRYVLLSVVRRSGWHSMLRARVLRPARTGLPMLPTFFSVRVPPANHTASASLHEIDIRRSVWCGGGRRLLAAPLCGSGLSGSSSRSLAISSSPHSAVVQKFAGAASAQAAMCSSGEFFCVCASACSRLARVSNGVFSERWRSASSLSILASITCSCSSMLSGSVLLSASWCSPFDGFKG